MTARRHERRGLAAAELALWLPFLSLMFVVALDFCRVFYTTQVLENCARTAALYGSGQMGRPDSVPSDEQAAKNAAIADGTSLKPALAAENVTITYESNAAMASVQYEFRRLIPWPGQAQTVTLTRTCRMPFPPKLPGQ